MLDVAIELVAMEASFVDRTEDTATICVPVPGDEAVRLARLALDFDPAPPTSPPQPYGGVPVPGDALELESVSAQRERCPAAVGDHEADLD